MAQTASVFGLNSYTISCSLTYIVYSSTSVPTRSDKLWQALSEGIFYVNCLEG